MTTQCQREESGYEDEYVRRQVDLGSPRRKPTRALVADSHDESLDEPARPPCGSTTMPAAGASEAVRWLLTLADQLLRGSSDEGRRQFLGRPTTLEWSRLERVARLRDEFHATANRVARFAVDDCPSVDPVRTTAPTAASAVPPEQLLSQLDLTAGRLIAVLTPLAPRDWTRTCLMGDRVVTLGELVERVLDGAAHDLLELLRAAPVLAPEGVVTLTHGRSRRDRREAHLQTYSAARKENQDAAAL